jgi:hypothetical protein
MSFGILCPLFLVFCNYLDICAFYSLVPRQKWWASSYTLYTCTILFTPDIVHFQMRICSTVSNVDTM